MEVARITVKKLLAMLVMLALFVGACNTQEQGQSTSGDWESEEEPKADTKLQQQGQKGQNKQSEELHLGDAAELQGGGTLTVLTFTSPVHGQTNSTRAGNQFAVIDVEGCAGSAPTSLNPFYFHLQMQDNTWLHSTIPVAQPSLNPTELQPGDCIQGYVTFDVPQDNVPTMVLFTPPANNTSARWTL